MQQGVGVCMQMATILLKYPSTVLKRHWGLMVIDGMWTTSSAEDPFLQYQLFIQGGDTISSSIVTCYNMAAQMAS